jgi:fumarate reductase flavoprotein subunit
MDKYTEYTIENGISRRRFLSRAIVASCAGMVGFSGCKPNSPKQETLDKNMTYGNSSDDGALLSFLPKSNKIQDADIHSTKTFDVVVIGAGASGVPAALSAFENGVTVAVLQKENIAIS